MGAESKTYWAYSINEEKENLSCCSSKVDKKLTTANCYEIVEKNSLNPEIRLQGSES